MHGKIVGTIGGNVLMKMINGYIPTKVEWELYHNFVPSVFQRLFWLVWPTETYIKWLRYRKLDKEDCI